MFLKVTALNNMKFQAKLIGFAFLQELVCDKENT